MKYQRFTPSGCKDVGIRNLELVAKLIPLYILYSANAKYVGWEKDTGQGWEYSLVKIREEFGFLIRKGVVNFVFEIHKH